MSTVKDIINDLREKRLWPVALVLLAALVAIPVLLTKKAPTPVVAQLPQSAPAASTQSAGTAVSVQTAAPSSRLTGPVHDPFAQQMVSAAAGVGTSTGTAVTSGSTATATPLAGAAQASGATGSTGSGGSGVTASGGAGSGTSPAPGTSAVTPPHAPTGLSATDSYHVAVTMTNAAGGLDPIDPVERLSTLPSEQQALLIELGVLSGDQRVLFVVQPGTFPTGPGTCLPGPIDCEILSLAPGQIETLSTQSGSSLDQVGLFSVTAITIDHHPSVASANKARLIASAAGQRLLDQSTLPALSLFQYEPSVGAVVDLRNLNIGGI